MAESQGTRDGGDVHTQGHADGHGHGHGGFHGPKCWVLCAILGAIVGYVVTQLFPARFAEHGEHGGSAHVRVMQIEPSGEKFERLVDQTKVPWVDEPGSGVPAEKKTGDDEHAAEGDVHAEAHGGGHGAGHGPKPVIPLALCLPFAMLLGSIAIMPFINAKFWHAHYPDFAFFLGAGVLTYYLVEFGGYGQHAMLHAGIEYYAFIALVGGLFVASGGILVDVRSRGRATTNTLLLAIGAVIANIVGTTGASMLLIRPFLRMNEGRMRPLHAVFFIFIVSNCGGCLTPIGDPPLYLGFLKGVPFSWTLSNLWPMWLTVNTMLLVMFFLWDRSVGRADLRVQVDAKKGTFEVHERHFDEDKPGEEARGPLIVGWPSLGFVALLVLGVFIDPLVKKTMPGSALSAWPIGATFQLVMAVCAYVCARDSIRRANGFNFEPVKEVGFLFAGIFLTMAPALGYLEANAGALGIESPTQFYYATGLLSGVLDNAPTYASFLQAALGVLHLPMSAEGIAEFLRCSFDVVHTSGGSVEHVRFDGRVLLEAISLGAVFFGAMTYIGNGPNFMVKSIVDSAYAKGDGKGVRMPSFFAYHLYALAILLPVLVLNWLIWIR